MVPLVSMGCLPQTSFSLGSSNVKSKVRIGNSVSSMIRKRKAGTAGQGTQTGVLVYRHLRKEDQELRVIFRYTEN